MTDQKRVRILLKYVQRVAVQDVLSVEDNLYVTGGAGTGPLSGSKSNAVLSRAIEVRPGQLRLIHGGECTIFDDNVHVDDLVELSLEFRAQVSSEDDFDAKFSELRDGLARAIGTAVGSLATPARGAVGGAILAATSPALVRVLESMDGDEVLGIVHQRLKLGDYPDGFHGPFEWKFAYKSPSAEGEAGAVALGSWDYEIGYVMDVGPAR